MADTVQLLKKICWYVVLAPQHSTDAMSSSDQLTLLNLTIADKKINDIPLHKQLLKTFITKEVRWVAKLMARRIRLTVRSW